MYNGNSSVAVESITIKLLLLFSFQWNHWRSEKAQVIFANNKSRISNLKNFLSSSMVFVH